MEARNAAVEPLALRVSRDGPLLRLDWDRQSPAVKAAKRAILSIDDGGMRKQLELDDVQTATGGVAYWPTSGDVNFRLDVFAPSIHASGSLRAFGVPPAPDSAPAATSPLQGAGMEAPGMPPVVGDVSVSIPSGRTGSADRRARAVAKTVLRPFELAVAPVAAPKVTAFNLTPPEAARAGHIPRPDRLPR